MEWRRGVRPGSLAACAAAVVLGATVSGGALTPAGADDIEPDGRAGGTINDADEPTAEAGESRAESGRGGSGGGRGPSTITCTSEVWTPPPGFVVYVSEGVPAMAPTGRWITRTCRDSATGAVTESFFAESPSVDPAALAEEALRSVAIPVPVIRTSPTADALVVRIPTWLWVEGAWWRPYSATATAGTVSATATAQPVRTIWETGDGATVTCEGPGTPWVPGMAEDETQCSHSYTSSSEPRPSGLFDLTVTVEFGVSWTSNIGAAGSLGAITRSATEAVRVGEIQAIETR